MLKYVCGPLKKALKILLKNKEKNTSDEGVQLQEMMRVDFYTHVRESLLCICCCWWSSSLLLKVALIFDWRHFFIHHGYYFTGCPDKFWIRKLRNKTIFKNSKSLISSLTKALRIFEFLCQNSRLWPKIELTKYWKKSILKNFLAKIQIFGIFLKKSKTENWAWNQFSLIYSLVKPALKL